jgi:hypothetical protein
MTETDTRVVAVDPRSGIDLDEQGGLATDLLCWTCDYNLRTQRVDATCPECGTPVAITIENRDARKARSFSLHTMTPVSRTLGLIFGLIGPALVVVSAGTMPMDPMNADWQSGEIEEVVGTMLSGRAMWAFYPFLLWAYIAYGAVMCVPLVMGRQWWVRAGLFLGCVLGLQYQLIIGLNLMGLSEQFAIAIFLGMIPLAVLAGIVGAAAGKDSRQAPKPRAKRSAQSTGLQIGITLALILLPTFLTGVPLLIILLAGPYLMLLCMGATLCRVYRTHFDPPMQRTRPLPAAATALGYAAAWPMAVSQAQIVYSSLPTQPPGCYVCTASARGHRWLTGAEPVRFGDGCVVLVTRQMRILKAAELLLAERVPRCHRALRGVYDRVGPAMASRIVSPWFADTSYVLLIPVALVARVALRLLGRSGTIHRAYTP